MRGANGNHVAQQHGGAAAADGDAGGAELGDEHIHVSGERVARGGAHGGDERLGGVYQFAHRVGGVGRWRVAHAANNEPAVGVAEVGEARQRHDEREAIGQGGVERFHAVVATSVVALHGIWGRIGGGPAVAQPFNGHALNALLVDNGEQLVRHIGATAADLIEERHLGLPDGPRGRGIANSAGIVGDGEANEIVELQNAGVVVAEGKAECVGEAHQQQRFRGAVIADQQQRLLGGESGQERRLKGVIAHNAERAEEGAGGGCGCGGGRGRDFRRRGVTGGRACAGGGARACFSRDNNCHGETSAQGVRRARQHAGRRDVSGPL